MMDTTTLNALKERYGEELVRRVEKLCAKADKEGVKIATAESATAGGIAHLIASVNPNVLARGNVTYNNRAKTDLLDVNAEMLETHEAVWPDVAHQMAEGALNREPNALISVSVTGYAGTSCDPTRDLPTGTTLWDAKEGEMIFSGEGIANGTVFVGAGWKRENSPVETRVQGFHFDGARTLDIRSTLVAAVGALEVALEEQLGQTPEETIAQRYAQARPLDPWLNAEHLDNDYATQQSGEPADSLLQNQYGAQIVQNVRKLLKDCKDAKLTISVVGDDAASEVCHLLTTLNGSSSVVDRGHIVPNDNRSVQKMIDDQKDTPARLLVAAKTHTDGTIDLAIATNEPIREEKGPNSIASILQRETKTEPKMLEGYPVVVEPNEAVSVPREIALAALENLQQHMKEIQLESLMRA